MPPLDNEVLLMPGPNRLATLLVTTTFLSGCGAARYEASGFTETPIADDVYTVHFSGNQSTTFEQATDFALLRCAELALTNGFGYFAIMNEAGGEGEEVVGVGGAAAAALLAQATGEAETFSFQAAPSTTNTIRFFAEAPDDILTYDAQFVYDSVTGKYDLTLPAPRSR